MSLIQRVLITLNIILAECFATQIVIMRCLPLGPCLTAASRRVTVTPNAQEPAKLYFAFFATMSFSTPV